MRAFKRPKFTKREQAKLRLVLDHLRARLAENLEQSGSRYDNDMGCGNCGDTGPFYGTLYEIEKLVGLRNRKGKVVQS